MTCHRFLRAAAALASLTLAGTAGCAGPSGDDCVATNQDEALACLGVPADDAPRHDVGGAPLPESYAPLGETKAVGVSAELKIATSSMRPRKGRLDSGNTVGASSIGP